MLIKDCKTCKYCAWLVGVGQGVRCGNQLNWDDGYAPQISRVKDCPHFELNEKSDEAH